MDVVHAAVRGGVTMIQLRNKTGDQSEVAYQARLIMNALRPGRIPLIINDYVDVAAYVEADGVHLGQGDCSPALAREILGPEAIVGLTAFTREHYEAIDPEVVDYVGTGPVYPTKTDKGKPVLGPENFADLIEHAPVPVVGIGGITTENPDGVMKAGADGLAMMRSVSEAEYPDIAANLFFQVSRRYALKVKKVS